MNEDPYTINPMPDTFVDLGEASYGANVDDYQAQMNDFDLRGPNVQYLPPVGGAGDEEDEECQANLAKCTGEREDLEGAVAELTETICVTNDAIKQLTGLDVKVGGYFEVRNATASYQIGAQVPVPVDVTFIVYQRTDDLYRISYDSTTASSNARWILESEVLDGDNLNIGGPYNGNTSSDAPWVFNVGVNCNIPLNIKVYNSLQPTYTATAPVSQLPCSEDFVDICAPEPE